MNQLSLHLPPVAATGQSARHLISADQINRLRKSSGLAAGDHFYLMHTGNDMHVWGGRGQLPRWVRDWKESGGDVQDLKARI